MSVAFFVKELPSNPIWLPDGSMVPFIDIGQGLGAIETSDEVTITELNSLAEQHIMGVGSVSETKFRELLKKKPSLMQFSRNSETVPLTQAGQPRLPLVQELQGVAPVVAEGGESKPEVTVAAEADSTPTRGRRAPLSKTS